MIPHQASYPLAKSDDVADDAEQGKWRRLC
jgi:hypothetical protein